MLANTWTINSTTVLDARFGFLRWDYDREPGNLGINLTQQFGFAQTPYGEISERSGIPGMETIPSIAVTNNNTINTGLIYADDRTYTFTPTLTKIKGDHTIKVGANWLRGEVNYFQNNNPGGTFAFTNAPTALDGTNPGSTGDGFAAFLLGLPTGGTYQSSSYTYGRSTYQAYFAEDSWQVNDKLTVNLGLRWEIPGVFTEKDDNLSTFNPDVVNPLLTGVTNPVTGQPFLGAFELVNTDERPGRGMRKNPLDLVVPRLGFAYQLTPGTVIRGGGGKFIVPSTVRFPDGPTGHGINQRVNNMQPSVDNNRTFVADLTNPFPNGVENYPGRSDTFQQALLGGGANQFIYDPDGYPGFGVSVEHRGAAPVRQRLVGGGHLHGPRRQPSGEHPQLQPARAGPHQPGRQRHVGVQSDQQRHHPVRRAGLRLEPARHLLRRLPAPAGAQSARRPDSRRDRCPRPPSSARCSCCSSRSTSRPTSRATTAAAATTPCSCAPTSASAPAASSAPTTPSRRT